MTEQFLHDLDRLAQAIDRDDRLDLIEYEVLPPEDDLTALQQSFPQRIPRDVLNFYSLVGAVKFRWRFRPDLPHGERARVLEGFSDYTGNPEEVFELAGSIRILPISVVLLAPENALPEVNIDEAVDFAGASYSDRTFMRMLRPFDAVDDYYAMALVVEPQQEWKLLWLTNHWIAYESSQSTTLTDYLNFTTTTLGLITARSALFEADDPDTSVPLAFDENLARSVVPAVCNRS